MAFIQYKENGIKKFFEISGEKMIIFGREEYVDFQIESDPLLSREHFGIQINDKQKPALVDLGASNGTYLNGKLLEKNSTVELVEGDEIKAGEQIFYYFRSKPAEKPQKIFNELPPEPLPQGEKTFAEKMRDIVKTTKKF